MTNQPSNYKSHSTTWDTPASSEYYPGKLNTDASGNPLITPASKVEDHIKSIKYQSEKHGTTHFSEIKSVYPNPKVTKEDIEPSGDPNLPPDRTRLFQKIVPEANNPDFDPNLRAPDQEVSFKSVLPDLSPRTFQGDPRWSKGYALQTGMQKFIPWIKAYEEMLNSGGNIIQDDCICTADGVAISKASPLLIQTVKDCGVAYGNSPTRNTIVPPTSEDVYNFMMENRATALKAHADAFVTYLNKYYLKIPNSTWKLELIVLRGVEFFFVKLSRPEQELVPFSQTVKDMGLNLDSFEGDTRDQLEGFINKNTPEDQNLEIICLRYYTDQKDYIAESLGIEITYIDRLNVSPRHMKSVTSLSSPIPDYTSLI